MKSIALVIMAAGIGSRFGGGIKQLEPVGPHGEIIMDYSIHDALEAGFNKIVFIIRKDLEKDFKEIIGQRIEKITEVSYAYQELEDLPDGFEKPEGRTKPWGTGQAILSCKGLIDTPFVVINADDYYGKEAFHKLYDYLIHSDVQDRVFHFCMAGFILKNTLSDNGGVTRGICEVDEHQHLTGVRETSGIVKTPQGAGILEEDETILPIDASSHVSMNMWGFTPDILEALEKGFVDFLASLKENPLKKEFLLPIFMDQLIHENRAVITVIETKDKWFGVTYREDKDTVIQSFRELIDAGVYPDKLF